MLVTRNQLYDKKPILLFVALWIQVSVSSSNQNRKCPCTLCKSGCRYPVGRYTGKRFITRDCIVFRELAERTGAKMRGGFVSAHLKWKCTRRFPRHQPRRFISVLCSRNTPFCSVIRWRDLSSANVISHALLHESA